MAKPSGEEYWHMGETPMRLGKITERRWKGERSTWLMLGRMTGKAEEIQGGGSPPALQKPGIAENGLTIRGKPGQGKLVRLELRRERKFQ